MAEPGGQRRASPLMLTRHEPQLIRSAGSEAAALIFLTDSLSAGGCAEQSVKSQVRELAVVSVS